jgi:hypothetical protein
MATVRPVRVGASEKFRVRRKVRLAARAGSATMKMVIRIGDVMATQKRGEHFTQSTQANSRVILPAPSAKRSLSERHGHEEWRQRSEADWQRHLETLQQCVGELLVKNQQLRMSLMAADERERGYRNAIGLRG